ncbi:hypothetical protein D9M72_536330 [compost metagenome]
MRMTIEHEGHAEDIERSVDARDTTLMNSRILDATEAQPLHDLLSSAQLSCRIDLHLQRAVCLLLYMLLERHGGGMIGHVHSRRMEVGISNDLLCMRGNGRK